MKQLWIFDFDGTLAELVPNRALAAILPESQLMLKELTSRSDTSVAILTSRTLEDVRLRIDTHDLYLGGSSGLFWQDPQQNVVVANPIAKDRAVKLREVVLPLLRETLSPFAVDLEDKFVSVTIHYRNLDPDLHSKLALTLQMFATAHKLNLFQGPFAHEIPLDSAINKTEGLRSLFMLFPGEFDTRVTSFAGDDTNDAQAMSWLIENGGRAVVVDNRISVAGAYNVASPKDLINLIHLECTQTSV